MTTRLPQPSPLRRRRGMTVATRAVAALLLLFAGFLLGRTTADPPSAAPAPQPSASASASDVGPRTVIDGVPVGFSRTQRGAVAAAIAFAEIMTTAAGDPDAHVEAMEAIAAPEWRGRAAELALNTADFLRESYPNASLSFAPIRYDVVEYTSDAATIKVWGLTVIFPPDGQPEQSWVTGTLRLVWLDDWRMNGGSSSAGPTPFVLKSPEELDWHTISGFTDIGDDQQP